MRVVGGEYKGRVFKPGKNFKARPTTDIAKEGLFNILNNRYDFSELKVLDLFAGTGSISYEFASRGSLDITLVELNYNHLKFIHKVISELKISSIKPVKGNVFKFIKKCTESFDIVFADPPFDLPDLGEIPDILLSSTILKEKGVFILEHSKRASFNEHEYFLEQRSYGNVCFSFFAPLKKS